MTYHDTVNRGVFLLLVTVLLGGCAPDPQYQVVEPPLVPFEELFVFEGHHQSGSLRDYRPDFVHGYQSRREPADH